MRSRLPVLLAVAAALGCMALIIPGPAVQSSISNTPSRPKKTAHEKFATFLNGDGFKAELLLENLHVNMPMEVHASLILRSGEVPLKTVTLAAHSSQTIDISEFMEAHGYADTRGTVHVKFDFSTYGPLTAVAESEDEANHVYLNSFAQSAEEYWDGTAYDAVIWAPNKDTKGFVSIINTSFETKTVRVTLLADGHSETRPVTVGSRETQFLPIDDLVARSHDSGAGIHVQYDEYPGDIVVEGQIYNQQTGFAKNIHFADVSLKYPTATLRTHFALLGMQAPQDGYPSGVTFRSVAAVRNIDTAPLTVTPELRFLHDGSVGTVTLRPVALGVGESKIIDLSEAQKKGLIPADVRHASLELVPQGNKGSIVAELFNFDENTGGYVVGPSFTSYPNHASASIWRTDGTFQTEAVVENTASQDDTVTLKAFSEDGTSYVKKFAIAAGGMLEVNLKRLQEDQITDDSGKLLTGNSGVIQFVAGHGLQSKLSFDKVVHSADEADYVGLPANPCDYVISVFDFVDFNGQSPLPMMTALIWDISGEEDEQASQTVSSNTSYAQISNSGSGDKVTFTWPNDSTQHSVTLSYWPGQMVVADCDACTGGDEPVEPSTVSSPPMVTFSPNPLNLAVGQTGSVTATVTSPSNNTTPVSLSISGSAAFVGTPGTFTSSETVTVKGLSAGSATLMATVSAGEGGSQSAGSASITVTPPVPASLRVLSVAVLPDGSSGNYGCLSGFTDGIMLDIAYQVIGSDGNPLQSSQMVPQESGTFADGSPFSGNVGPTRISDTSEFTNSQGVYHDAPVGDCANFAFNNHRITQNVAISYNGTSYPVRSQVWTVSGTSPGHGTITNGSDITQSR